MLLKSFLKSTLTGVKRDPVTTIIQVGGLVIAITVFLLIAAWVEHELSFDRFNTNADRIYRVEFNGEQLDGWVGQHTMLPLYMKEKIPEIENFVRFRSGWGKDGENILSYQPEGKKEQRVKIKGSFFFADSSFFNVFSFDLLVGNPCTVLKHPNSVVISDETAKKMFGSENPVGKTLKSGNTITGIYKKVNNFHISNDWIVSLSSLTDLFRRVLKADLDNWSLPNHPTYLLLKKGADPVYVEQKMTEWFNVIRNERWTDLNVNLTFQLRPLNDIYFNGATKDEGYYARHGNKKMVIAFIAIGLFVLLIACINFINLSTAKSAARAREIGIRKVNGSTKKELVSQFLIEIFAYCGLAFILAISLIQFILPYFNNLIQGDLDFKFFLSFKFWIWSLIGTVLITFIAGFVPSYFYSRLKSTKVLHEYTVDTKRSLLVRRFMLIGQYIVSTILIIAVLVIFKQLNYMKKADPGFRKEQRIVFGFNGDFMEDKLEPIKERLLRHPDIYSVTHCFGVPGSGLPYGSSFTINNEQVQLRRINVDENYFNTLGIPVVKGRNFELARQGDVFNPESKINRIILNEAAVKAFKLKDPVGAIGHGLNSQNQREVIGVVRDFHFSSLKEKIQPIGFNFVKGKGSYNMIVHVNTDNLQAVNQHMRETALYFFPDMDDDIQPNYDILEDQYDAQYQSEEKLGELFIYFTFFTILIACLGLYGLSAYSVARRTREIAIRKANGALIPEIFVMVVKDYLFWISLALLVALPVGYWVMNRWLQEFAYHIGISWTTLVEACMITLVVAIITVLYQTLKAAMAKPAEALKYE